MSTVEKTPAVDPQIQADHEAAERYFIDGKPFPPDLDHRIQQRAEKVRQRLGQIDVNRLVHETHDER